MKKVFTIVGLLLASFCFAGQIVAQTQWREATNQPPIVNTTASDAIEISGKDGHIIVRLPHKAQVKVFTILGQLVSQADLNAGVSTLKMNSRGIYIVKVGNVTQKVAL